MKTEHKAVLGFLLIMGLLIAYGLFADALGEYGLWLWIPVIALIVVNIAAVVKSPAYRSWLGGIFKGGISAVAAYFAPKDEREHAFKRKKVPPAMQQKIFQRANNRCQYPGCEETGRRNLEVHHINMDPSDKDDEDNLIVVCPNHHKKIHNTDIAGRQVRNWAKGQYQPTRRRRPDR